MDCKDVSRSRDCHPFSLVLSWVKGEHRTNVSRLLTDDDDSVDTVFPTHLPFCRSKRQDVQRISSWRDDEDAWEMMMPLLFCTVEETLEGNNFHRESHLVDEKETCMIIMSSKEERQGKVHTTRTHVRLNEQNLPLESRKCRFPARHSHTPTDKNLSLEHLLSLTSSIMSFPSGHVLHEMVVVRDVLLPCKTTPSR
jgi:hypothetical protein